MDKCLSEKFFQTGISLAVNLLYGIPITSTIAKKLTTATAKHSNVMAEMEKVMLMTRCSYQLVATVRVPAK